MSQLFPATNQPEELAARNVSHGLVEIRITLEKPQVYIDLNVLVCSKNKTYKYSLTLRPGQKRTRLIRIPPEPYRIFIEQKREAVEFAISKVELVKFPLPISIWIIKKRLEHFKRPMPQNAEAIWRAYNQTFSTALGIKNYQSWIRYNEEKNISEGFSRESKELSVIYFDSEKPGTDESLKEICKQQAKNFFVFSKHGNYEQNLTLKKQIQNQRADDYFLILKDGDNMPSWAFGVINRFLKKCSTEIIYCDEDQIVGGHRAHPEFKPDWNPEYFLESNYTGRGVIFPTWALSEVDFDGFSPTLESIGLLLSQALQKKPHTDVLHIARICLNRAPEPSRNRFSIPWIPKENLTDIEQEPSVDILIPTRDRIEVLKPCVESILCKTTYQNYQITVIDNQSSDNTTLEYLSEIKKLANVRVLTYTKPFNYSAINNFAAKKSDADVLILLNNDIEVMSPEWMGELIIHATKKGGGCVGAKLFYPNGWIQHAGVILGVGDVAGHGHRFYPGNSDGYMNRLTCTQRVSAVTAACLAVRKSIWDELNGLDEENLTVAYNDIDFCLRVKAAGYQNIWTPYAQLIHHESVSRGADNTIQKRRRYNSEVRFMRRRWKSELDSDPFYNPALSKTKEDFSLLA